jgi:hypothetical protein
MGKNELYDDGMKMLSFTLKCKSLHYVEFYVKFLMSELNFEIQITASMSKCDMLKLSSFSWHETGKFCKFKNGIVNEFPRNRNKVEMCCWIMKLLKYL